MSKIATTCSPPDNNFKSFLSCFNRSDKNSRHFLLARLYQLGWYNQKYCTKHFPLDLNQIKNFGIDTKRLDSTFVESANVFDFNNPVDHDKNFSILSPMVRDTFVHLVSETISLDSLEPFPTEKFLYAIANRRLWVALAPPNYHKLINQKFGFELYSCFDYEFDSCWHAPSRLEALLAMLDRFSRMTPSQWQKVYQSQQQQIEYNYQRLASFEFFDHLATQDQMPWPYNIPLRLNNGTVEAAWDRYSNARQKNSVLPNVDK